MCVTSTKMDHSIILIQICPKFLLYTKWLYLKWATFKYPKWKLASEIGHFLILLKLTQNFLQFQNKQIQN